VLEYETLQITKKSFTLIEAIIVIVIIGILGGIGVPLTFELVDSSQYSLYRRDLSESADVILKRMSREIRRLKDDTSVLIANSTTYRFIDIDNVTVQFQISGDQLNREYNGLTDSLAANISSFGFSYFDDTGGVLPAPLVNPLATDIRFVAANMTLSWGNNSISYITSIRPRNVVHICDLFP